MKLLMTTEEKEELQDKILNPLTIIVGSVKMSNHNTINENSIKMLKNIVDRESDRILNFLKSIKIEK